MKTTDTLHAETMVVILAAGKGTRMGGEHFVKVCCEIDGIPAIARLLSMFKSEGFGRFMLVVAQQAQRVMETVGHLHQDLLYVYQDQQLGTGHAARMATNALQTMRYPGPILISMGDKYIECDAVKALTRGFREAQADLALLTVPASEFSDGSGRVVTDASGQVYDIIEKTDLARQQIADDIHRRLAAGDSVSPAIVREIIQAYLPNSRKQRAALGPLLGLAENENAWSIEALIAILKTPAFNLVSGGRQVSATDIERDCCGFNPSLYMFSPAALFAGIPCLDCSNAQGEYYLTDIVKHLSAMKTEAGAQRFRIRSIPFDNPRAIQGFNSPQELSQIEAYVRTGKSRK